MLTPAHTSRRPLGRPPAKQRGAMLIEALVAVLLLMLGILSLIGLQGRMVSASTDAQLRGEATFLADQLIGSMWVDQANLSNYTVTSGTCSTTSNANCTNWTALVSQKLPSGTSTVTVNGSVVTVSVLWTPAHSTQHRVDVVAAINY